jgi:hypothetical protein
MSSLLILIKMQLKEQLNFQRFDLKGTNWFKIVVSVLVAIAKFLLVIALCGTFLTVAKLLSLFSLTNTVPSTVISLVFTLMMLASIVSCTVGLTKSLYFARDNAVLLTLPCKPIQVYLSKLIIFFIFELIRNFSFVVPLFIAYYVTHGYAWYHYLWLMLCILLVSLFTVSVGTLLSIPAMWISNLFRQFKSLQTVTLVGSIALVSFAVFHAISLIPENIDLIATWGTTFWEIQDFLNAYATKFSFIYDFTLMMLGETHNLVTTFPIGATALRFFKLLGATAVLYTAGLLIVQPLFYKMASKPFEHMKRRTRTHKNRKLPRPVSVIWTEVLVAMKTPARIFFNVGVLFSIPMLIFLLNKIFLAMNTRETGNYMVLAFNVLIILLVVLNANTYAASVFSRDGRSSYLIKVQPTQYRTLLQAKLLPNMVFVLAALVATLFILLGYTSFGTTNTFMLVGAITALYVAHLLFCAELDLMNPQNELYAAIGNSEKNPNETTATLTAFLISFAVAGALFFLMMEGSRVFLKFLIVSLALLFWRGWLFFSKIKVYYKEK